RLATAIPGRIGAAATQPGPPYNCSIDSIAALTSYGAMARKPKSAAAAKKMRKAKYAVGQVVKHRFYPFRGIVFDIDPTFNNTEEWWQSIPEDIRPKKDQPFYHLLAENAETEYIAYVSEQNLLPDKTGKPLRHPQIGDFFVEDENGGYRAVFIHRH